MSEDCDATLQLPGTLSLGFKCLKQTGENLAIYSENRSLANHEVNCASLDQVKKIAMFICLQLTLECPLRERHRYKGQLSSNTPANHLRGGSVNKVIFAFAQEKELGLLGHTCLSAPVERGEW